MLLDFSFKNFRSFFDNAELSMKATRKKDHLNKLIITEGIKEKILPVVVIYGGNASGKTTVVLAQQMLKEIILKTNVSKIQGGLVNNLPICSFIHNLDKYETPMEFNITFIDTEDNINYDKINYKCIIKNIAKPIMRSTVIAEELNINNVNIFKRNEREVSFNQSSNVKKYYNMNASEFQIYKDFLNIQAKNFSKDMSDERVFTSWYSNLNIKLVDRISKWFSEKYLILYDFNEAKHEYNYEGDISNLKESNGLQNIIIRDYIINSIKECIETGPQDIILFGNETEETLNKTLQLRSMYKINNNKNENMGIEVSAEFSESKGTLKMYKFLFPFIEVLKKGTTLVVDELDASLHPELVMGIIKIFKNMEINKKGAQLIFNTHNPLYLNNNIFRRDELYFVQKDKKTFQSELYSLVDFIEEGNKIRSDENYMKNYMNGKYGALPYVDLENTIIDILNKRGE